MKRKIFTCACLVMGLTQMSAQHPGGVKSPSVWFSTEATNQEDKNGTYKWVDQTGSDMHLYKRGTTDEVIAERAAIHTYNFNPAMPFDSTVNTEFVVSGTNLSQKTVVAVVGAKKKDAGKEAFLYNLNGKTGEGRIFSKTRVIHTTSSGKTSYDYDPNLILKDSAERVKVVSYLEALQPEISLWKQAAASRVNVGGKFSQAIVSDQSTFDDSIVSRLGASDFFCPEMVVYSRFLRGNERKRVESYLALKYGITLNDSYYNSLGVKIWENSSSYKHRVTGYGKDERSNFNQKESTTAYEENAYDVDDTYHKNNSEKRSSSKNLIVMGLMDDEEFQDDSYVIFADNKLPTSVSEIPNMQDSIDYTDTLKVMQRAWKVVTHGVDSSIFHQLELGYNMTADSAFALYRNDNVYMLVDHSANGDFSGPVDTIRMSGVDEEREKIIFSELQFDSLCYFTFAFSGIPLEKQEEKTYEYTLELENPTCGLWGGSNNDGSVKLILPESGNGFYYTFENVTDNSPVQTTHDSVILIDNLGSNTYLLKVMPIESNTIDFVGEGISYINLNFINNEGSITWTIENAETESKVAFISSQVSQYNLNDNIFAYGVKVENGKLYRIINGVVDNTPLLGDIQSGDIIKLERYGKVVNNQWSLYARCFVNNNSEPVFDNVNMGNTNHKVGFKTVDGNISKVTLDHFGWNGNYPDILFNKYQNPPVFVNSENVQASMTGFMTYWIDLNINCSDINTSSNDGMIISRDVQNRSFTVDLTINVPGQVVFYVYDVNGSMQIYETTHTSSNHISKTFHVQKPSEYLIKAIAPDGTEYNGRTELP